MSFSEGEVPDLWIYRMHREWALDHRLVVVAIAVFTPTAARASPCPTSVRLQLISARIQQEQTLDDIHTDIDTAWADYLSARSQVGTSAQQVELAEAALEQARIVYDNTVTTQLDFIDAQDPLTIARINIA